MYISSIPSISTLNAALAAFPVCGTEANQPKSTFDGSKTSDETGFRMEYSILNKEESVEMRLTEGNQIQVHISHTAGNVDVIVG